MQGAAGLEAAVGEVAVEADRDAEPGREVEGREEGEIAPVERLAPDLPGGEAERQEGDQRHQAGDDPVAGLVGDRLGVVRPGAGSRLAGSTPTAAKRSAAWLGGALQVLSVP
jgi:hypothetical protein